MIRGGSFVLLVCCALAGYAAGQGSSPDQCKVYLEGYPAYYTCIIKCFQFVMGFSDSRADYCAGKFKLTNASKDAYNNGHVVNTLKCIALKCKQFAPNEVCEDSSSDLGRSTEFSDFTTVISTMTYYDDTTPETSTGAETTISDSSSSTPSSTSRSSVTTPSSISSAGISSSTLFRDNSMVTTTLSPPTDDAGNVDNSGNNDNEQPADADECEEDEDMDGNSSLDVTDTALFQTDLNPSDEDCDDNDSPSTDDSSSANGGSDEDDSSSSGGEGSSADPSASAAGFLYYYYYDDDDNSTVYSNNSSVSAVKRTRSTTMQPSQATPKPSIGVTTDYMDGYSSESSIKNFRDDTSPNEQQSDDGFRTSNEYNGYAGSDAGAGQDSSLNYVLSNSPGGNNNPQFQRNPNWIAFGNNPQQALPNNFQQTAIYPQQQQSVYPQQNRRWNYNNNINNWNNPQPDSKPRYFAQNNWNQRPQGSFPPNNQGYQWNQGYANNNGGQMNTGNVRTSNNGGFQQNRGIQANNMNY